MFSAAEVSRTLKKYSNPRDAIFLQRFFKTGPGEYSEGDIFIGLRVPQTREIVKQFKDLPLAEVQKLLKSKIHEERLCALLILVSQYKKGNAATQKKIYDLYLKSMRHINNWDLVDSSAEHIVGPYLKNRDKKILVRLAHSKDLWERRIAMLSTFHYIKEGNPAEAIKIAKILLKDEHDLIHKAVGWMLREIGKRCSPQPLKAFLRPHYKIMPRTMLRYAIEHFPQKERMRYLKGVIS